MNKQFTKTILNNKSRKSAKQSLPLRRGNNRNDTNILVSTTGIRYPLERVGDLYQQNIYHRRIEYETVVFAAAADRFYAQYFVLASSGSANLNAYATIFDQFKINEVLIEWVPQAPTPGSTVTVQGLVSRISSVLDFDDSVVPIAESLLKEYPTYKTGITSEPMGRRYAATERVLLTNDGTTSAISVAVVPSGSIGGGWIDIASVGYKVLGTKWFIEGIAGLGSATDILGRFVFSASVSFRQGR
jgi:hypothetical protein